MVARKTLGVITLALAFLAADSAEATTIVGAPPESPFQAWTDESLAPTPVGALYLSFGSGRYAWLRGKRNIVWYQEGVGYDEGVGRPLFLHEVGHAFDATLPRRVGRWTRRAFMRLTKAEGKWWEGRDSPGEQFAMAYSYCALGISGPTSTWWGYGYNPPPKRQRRACALIRRAGKNPRELPV